jgi:hypothetical protein
MNVYCASADELHAVSERLGTLLIRLSPGSRTHHTPIVGECHTILAIADDQGDAAAERTHRHDQLIIQPCASIGGTHQLYAAQRLAIEGCGIYLHRSSTPALFHLGRDVFEERL